tara:strand:+ start:342 stop:581 length:240 start_codon:yes stop_codon:yes gene_type:complete
MVSGITYGFLNDWATVFQMNNETDRGWVWRADGDAAGAGAMSLTTDGRLYLDSKVDATQFNFRSGGEITSDGSTMRFQF